ncbi:hypothetical protein BDN70DRAFT_899206 [Pholiota conissans]|uniref:Uncharacterized protein n=1 Tax=Pholiota conissans TaxID=109636 RepID=A0A9P5YUQ8_9AGAR|nr:hypothetical protein BDN70DRAFT_899206 [Pholiota conissans]
MDEDDGGLSRRLKRKAMAVSKPDMIENEAGMTEKPVEECGRTWKNPSLQAYKWRTTTVREGIEHLKIAIVPPSWWLTEATTNKGQGDQCRKQNDSTRDFAPTQGKRTASRAALPRMNGNRARAKKDPSCVASLRHEAIRRVIAYDGWWRYVSGNGPGRANHMRNMEEHYALFNFNWSSLVLNLRPGTTHPRSRGYFEEDIKIETETWSDSQVIRSERDVSVSERYRGTHMHKCRPNKRSSALPFRDNLHRISGRWGWVFRTDKEPDIERKKTPLEIEER